jgi:hypothetical protein
MLPAMRSLILVAVVIGCASPSPAPTVASDVASPRDADDATADVVVVPDVATAMDAPTTTDVTVVDVAPTPQRVLFIGNSYTFYNDLPRIVSRIADESGARIEVDSVTVGGASFRTHWEGGTAVPRVQMGPWDAVVLQGQSVEPVLNFNEFRLYAQRFTTLIAESRTRSVFFATWARRAGDTLYAQPWSGGTPDVFAMRLDTAYTQVAMPAGSTVARVGLAWQRALRAAPTINLYDSDGSHPSPAGSWLAACVLYRAITGNAPAAVADTVAPMLSASDARTLRLIAAEEM